MPRTGGVYAPPAGTKGTPNTTIQSSAFNAWVDDMAADANAARPLTAGGTGATNKTDARVNLGVGTTPLGLGLTNVASASEGRDLLLAQVNVGNTDRLQIGANYAGPKDTWVDFYSGINGAFSTRLIRSSGNDGGLLLFNTGAGSMGFSNGSGGIAFSASGGAFTYNGGKIWTDSLASSGAGWEKLPSGLIIQRAVVNVAANSSGDGTISLPTLFSNANYIKVAWFADSSIAAVITSTGVKTASTFSIRATYLNGTPVVGSINIEFIAIGV